MITEIRQTKRGRISVYVDGEFAGTLHQEVYALSPLEKGMEVEPEDLEAYFAQSREKDAKERALNLLSYRDRTAKQLFDRLKEKTDEASAAQAVERMEELGLVDDVRYAGRLSRDLWNLKHYGPQRIRQELLQKGIDRQVAQEAVQELMEGVDLQQELQELVLRRYLPLLHNEKDVKRLINRLLRMGYRYEDILPVLRACQEAAAQESTELEEDPWLSKWE